MDSPQDERRVNKVEMPRLGGLAVIAGFIISVVYLLITLTIENQIDLLEDNYNIKLIGFFLGMLPIVFICFIDDVKGVHAIIKLIFHIIAAIIVVKCGIIIDGIKIGFLADKAFSETFSIILTIGWIVGITNAINLIDGLDGLSSGIGIISSISLVIIFALNGSPLISIILITALAGALVGFLPYNFNPAKTFIGDTGSNFLGYSLAVISIIGVAKTYTAIVIVAPLIVLALPVFDTLTSIVRRIIKGKSLKAIIEPDSGHLHYQILHKGFSQRQTVLMLYGISASTGLFAIILLESGIWKALSFGLIVIAVLSLGYKELFKKHDGE